MTLIVEDETGLVDAESYVSVADADAHHVGFNNEAWADLEEAVKEAALRKATLYLDGTYGTRFPGYVLNDAQALLWPRVWSGALLPLQIVKATCELALRASAGELADDVSRGPVQSETVGPISVSYFEGGSATKRFPWVDRILAPILSSGLAGGELSRS